MKLAEDKGVTLDKLPLDEMQAVDPAITQDVFKVLSLESSVHSRMSLGGTAPARCARAAGALEGAAQMKTFLMIAALALLTASCGVKNDLVKPNGQSTPRDQPDPSKPPYPLGR